MFPGSRERVHWKQMGERHLSIASSQIYWKYFNLLKNILLDTASVQDVIGLVLYKYLAEDRNHRIQVRLKFNFDILKPLSANPTKWSNTLKQFIGNSRRIV